MDSEDAARFMARAKELRDLARMMSLRKDRDLLLESAESFEKLARQLGKVEPDETSDT